MEEKISNHHIKSWSFDHHETNDHNYYNFKTFHNNLNEEENDQTVNEENSSEQDDEERMKSLEALRFALHHAPFCKNMHTLMSVPNAESYEMIGIPTKCAIRIEQLFYKSILDNINIDVPKGKIYGLLGTANNGKSILLQCILGRQKPSSGSIEVFEQKPIISPLSAICVGFMPKCISLHYELTIEQTLNYYGRIYQLPTSTIAERIKLLDSMFDDVHTKDFHIPPSTLVKDLDSGNQWRLSLMIAMIHSPPLLLLDEPTENVDPLVRNSVWLFLEKLCSDEGMIVIEEKIFQILINNCVDSPGLTVMFTTKHPEELCYAYKAGLMRDGHVYVEDRPEELLQTYRCSTYIKMYDKFYMSSAPRRYRPSLVPYLAAMTMAAPTQLSFQTSVHSCQTEQEEKNYDFRTENSEDSRPNGPQLIRKSSSASYSGESIDLQERLPLPMAQWPIAERRRTAYISHSLNIDSNRLLSLILKNIHIFRAHYIRLILFYFIFPMLQILLVCYVFSRSTIKNIPVTIHSDSNRNESQRLNKLIEFTVNRSTFSPKTIETYSEESVLNGKSWAIITPWLIEHSIELSSSQDFDQTNRSDCQRWLSYSQKNYLPLFALKLYTDNSNYFIYQYMTYTLISSMAQLLTDTDHLNQVFPKQCSELTHFTLKDQLQLSIKEILFGSKEIRFLEFLLPGFLVIVMFSHSLILSSYLFIREELDGLQKRCLIAGSTCIEILISHLISEAILLCIQEILLLIIARLYGIKLQSFFFLWSLIFMQGLIGIVTGLFIGVTCSSPISALLVVAAILVPGFILSGVVWPIESMNIVLYYISTISPLTLPIQAIRFIIARGSRFRLLTVLTGYSVSFFYTSFLSVLTLGYHNRNYTNCYALEVKGDPNVQKRLDSKIGMLGPESSLTSSVIEYSFHFRIALYLGIPFKQWLWCVIGILIGEIIISWIILSILIERALLLHKFKQDAQRRLARKQPALVIPEQNRFRFDRIKQSIDQSLKFHSAKLIH
ncbi:ABC transporter-like protein 4 [Sarcoptes scabiei]|uniref:ABC transporter-like protein 4 n=1 Tax=Sarcoptes scabiei TaxID=52283 RepID=A0A132A4S5_SARSC|nr:ABC transporter-like protein 4 [Sarcoptes scabiei]